MGFMIFQRPLLVLAMQDQWKAERVKWQKREADLLMKMAKMEAISTQRGKELDTLAAISKAKATTPTYVEAAERTSISGGRPVLNLDMQAGRPESEVDAGAGGGDGGAGGGAGYLTLSGGGGADAASNAMPTSPTQATLNNRVSWSGIGILPEDSAITATVSAAPWEGVLHGKCAPREGALYGRVRSTEGVVVLFF